MPERFRPPPDANIRLIVVFRTHNAALAAIAQSLLEGEGIEFATQGDAYGWDAPGVKLNLAGRPLEFLVRESDAHTARALLADLRSDTDSD